MNLIIALCELALVLTLIGGISIAEKKGWEILKSASEIIINKGK